MIRDFWRHLTKPVFGVVRNSEDLGLYCGWFVVWIDWSAHPLIPGRISFTWHVD